MLKSDGCNGHLVNNKSANHINEMNFSATLGIYTSHALFTYKNIFHHVP